MKRYDLAGNCKQFGAKQFWVVTLNARFDVWVSYNTAVAIVDHKTHEVYEGKYARGFSRTTSKQVGQAYYEFAHGYVGFPYGHPACEKFDNENGCFQINMWGDEWGKYNAATAATYFLKEALS